MEEEDRKQRERAMKKAEFEKWKNPPKPNFVISKRSGSADDEQEVTLLFLNGCEFEILCTILIFKCSIILFSVWSDTNGYVHDCISHQ